MCGYLLVVNWQITIDANQLKILIDQLISEDGLISVEVFCHHVGGYM